MYVGVCVLCVHVCIYTINTLRNSYNMSIHNNRQIPSAHVIIGASLSELHTSKKLGTVVTYTNNYEKSEQIPYLVGMIVHVTKGNKHSLLTLLI